MELPRQANQRAFGTFTGTGVMGKVKDEAPAKTTKPATKGGVRRRRGPRHVRLVPRQPVPGRHYKPLQGWYARLWTFLGLAVLVVAGVWRLYETQLNDPGRYSAPVRFGVPTALVAVLGWFVFRIVQYPPFVDFLIATEAEMNKVSWTTKDELKRATIVVLATVILMAVYLLGVDLVWQFLLKLIGVLQFDSTDFGSQAS